MVVDREAATDRAMRALADRTRRDIVRCTMRRDRSISELAQRYPMSFAAVQKHVATLEAAGLVTKRRHGREQLVRADPAAVRRTAALLDDLAALWQERMDRFEAVLAEPDDPTNTTDPTRPGGSHP